LDIIIEHSWPEQSHATQSKLIIAITNYRNAMKLLTVHRELSKDENEQFQDYVDDFFEIWIEVFGDEGITNYIHMLGSGHILYFMKKYGCLYLYSQKVWESLNNTIQAFIHQNLQ
jgi:reverse gyrase